MSLHSLITSIFLDAVPSVPLSKGVTSAATGILLCDVLPLLSLLPCWATIVMFWRNKRMHDVFIFSAALCLAGCYHLAHMRPGGLHGALLGIPGSAWRSLDILVAQSLLTRTLGHAVGAHTLTLTGALRAL